MSARLLGFEMVAVPGCGSGALSGFVLHLGTLSFPFVCSETFLLKDPLTEALWVEHAIDIETDDNKNQEARD